MMRDDLPQIAYIGIGANLGDAAATVRLAMEAIAALPGTRLMKNSMLYRTAPVGYLDQPDFINAVVKIETRLKPEFLLEQLLEIEQRFGRIRSVRNAPRTLDLDLLLYGDRAIESPTLTLPHPRMSERAFVLVPMVEIAPDVNVGGLGSARQLLSKISSDGVLPLVTNAGNVAAGSVERT